MSELPLPMNRSTKSKITVCILILSILFLGGFTCWPVIKSFAQIDYERAQFLSPGVPANQISFYDGRILDRDLFLYAEPKGQKAQLIYNLAWRPDASFARAQWTKDGQVIVCSLLVKADGKFMSVLATGFDFSENKALNSSWMKKGSYWATPESKWKKQESIIKGIVAAHGGLSDQIIDENTLEKSEKTFKTLWFWQAPA
jgi:hypothetical protein